jgi:hypothetical protein
MNNRRDRQTRITQISQQIDTLSTELNRLIIEDNLDTNQQGHQQQGNRPVPPITAPTDEQTELREGDRVEITNNYKGQRGSIGVITNVTRYQVSLRIEGQRRVISKKKSNVRKIE